MGPILSRLASVQSAPQTTGRGCRAPTQPPESASTPPLRSCFQEAPVQDRPRVGRISRVERVQPLPRREGSYGVVADFDQTLVPAHDGTPIPRPFPGIAALIHELQGEQPRTRRDGGYTHYVTARTLEYAAPLPAYLVQHGLPSPGNLHIGIETEHDLDKTKKKIADIASIIGRDPGHGFVLFGDSSHIDPVVYQEIKARYPDQITAAIIHRVKDNVPPEGYPGLIVVDDYADAALALHDAGVLSAQAALRVVACAELEGLTLRAAQKHRVQALEAKV